MNLYLGLTNSAKNVPNRSSHMPFTELLASPFLDFEFGGVQGHATHQRISMPFAELADIRFESQIGLDKKDSVSSQDTTGTEDMLASWSDALILAVGQRLTRIDDELGL